MAHRLRTLAVALAVAAATSILLGLTSPGTLAPGAGTRVSGIDAWSPPFVHGASGWMQPLPVLSTGIAGRLMPGHGGAAATIAAASITAALTYAVVSVFYSHAAGLTAALLLLLFPGFRAAAQAGTEAAFALPFVVLWLWAMLVALRSPGIVPWAVAGIALGAGVYSSVTGPLMAISLAIGTGLLALIFEKGLRPALAAVAVLGVFIVPGVLVWFRDPDVYMQTFGAWWLHPATISNPVDGLSAIVNRGSLSVRVSNYWTILNPATLFMNGPLLLGSLPLIVIGAAVLPGALGVVVATATLVMPIAPAILGSQPLIAGAPGLFPLAAVAAAAGAMRCWSGDRLHQAIGVACAIAIALQLAL